MDGGQLLTVVIPTLGTLIGTILGILASSKLTIYRIQILEDKVNKHNNLIERVYNIEGKINVLENKISVNNHRIKDIEQFEREVK